MISGGDLKEPTASFGAPNSPGSYSVPWASTPVPTPSLNGPLGAISPKNISDANMTKLIDMQGTAMGANIGMGAGSLAANIAGNILNTIYAQNALDNQLQVQMRMIGLAETVEQNRYTLQDKAISTGYKLQLAAMRSQKDLALINKSYQLEKAEISKNRDVELAQVNSLNRAFGQPYEYGNPLYA